MGELSQSPDVCLGFNEESLGVPTLGPLMLNSGVTESEGINVYFRGDLWSYLFGGD